jgi:hypothetical protein
MDAPTSTSPSSGKNQLFRNNCNETFNDVTRESRTSDSGWSVSATLFDFDRDGWLDLFVGHYLIYSTEHTTKCFSLAACRTTAPSVHNPEPNHLFHNNRDDAFSDVTAAAGMAADFGGALGAVTARLQRGRLGRLMRDQRRTSESAVDQSAQWNL